MVSVNQMVSIIGEVDKLKTILFYKRLLLEKKLIDT